MSGWLGRLFGKRRPAFEDRVWRTDERKLAGLAARLGEETSRGDATCLLVHHFPQTRERILERLGILRIAFEELRRPGGDVLENLSTRVGTSTVALVASDELPVEAQRGLAGPSRRGAEPPCHVHLAEHFPTPARDEHVLNLAALLPGGSRFFCYVGLDEAWLARFLDPAALELLDGLGAGEEPIEHAMVARSLRRAQEQIDRKRRSLEQPAHSCAEWVRLNLE